MAQELSEYTTTDQMDVAVRDGWVEALRSGRYQQGADMLVAYGVEFEANDRSYCCLGVLACEQGVLDSDVVRSFVNDHEEMLPPGMFGLSQDTQEVLAFANDNDNSFEDIAEWIAGNL